MLVICLPLVSLLLIVKCSTYRETLHYSKDEFVDRHLCNGNGNGTGGIMATVFAMAMGQEGSTATGNEDDHSINCNGTNGAMGKKQWGQGNGNGATEHSVCNGNGASINRVYIEAQNVENSGW
jgi:hypothetical protein